MKKICFRFDVDTYLCASKGVPNLIKLSNQYGVNFTFFYSMGRAVHLPSIFKSRKNKKRKPCADKFSNLYKLGWGGYIKTVFLNPFVGISYQDSIISAYKKGHEIGLHGGKNHGDWMRNAQSWKPENVKKEIEWGLSELHNIGINNVTSFSSPGWNAPPELNNILLRNGFRFLADIHGHSMEEIFSYKNNRGDLLNQVPTNLLGEPGGVGYIEHMRSKQMSDRQIIEKFRHDLNKINKLAVIYDHPYYSGIKELPLLKTMIHVAQSMEFHITTIRETI
ncbi:MAG: DUF2334 domain-containing protein [Candidatus Electrothrix sp. LOE1_4_5]|nr:DUF2334 domain-containing protein [Candidatus Electrothrix gigas]